MNNANSPILKITLNKTASFIIAAVLICLSSAGALAQHDKHEGTAESFGKVFIKSPVPDVKVFIDGVYRGPVNSTILSVRAGKRAISCQSGSVAISGVFMIREAHLNQWEARFDEGRFVQVLEKNKTEAAGKKETALPASAEMKEVSKEPESKLNGNTTATAAVVTNDKTAPAPKSEAAGPGRKSSTITSPAQKSGQPETTAARKKPPVRKAPEAKKEKGETWAVVIYVEKIGPTFSTVLYESSLKGNEDAIEKTKTACEQHAKKSRAFTYACEPIGTCSKAGWFAIASNVRGGGTAKFSCNERTEDVAIEAAKKACGSPVCAKVFSHKIKR